MLLVKTVVTLFNFVYYVFKFLDIHNKLRISKRGIPLLKIGEMPADYRRPPGFELIPGNFYSTICLPDLLTCG